LFCDCNKKKNPSPPISTANIGKGRDGILSLSILRGQEHFDKKKGKGVPFIERHGKEEGKRKKKERKSKKK